MDSQNNYVLDQINEEIAKTRKTILDTLELAFGEHPKWPATRSYVLNAFGERGLYGLCNRLLENSSSIVK